MTQFEGTLAAWRNTDEFAGTKLKLEDG